MNFLFSNILSSRLYIKEKKDLLLLTYVIKSILTVHKQGESLSKDFDGLQIFIIRTQSIRTDRLNVPKPKVNFKGSNSLKTVSYTHLTLPTIYSV